MASKCWVRAERGDVHSSSDMGECEVERCDDSIRREEERCLVFELEFDLELEFVRGGGLVDLTVCRHHVT